MCKSHILLILTIFSFSVHNKSAVGPLCLKHAGVHAPPLIKVLYIGKSKKIQPNLKVNYIQNENEDIAGMSR